MCRSIYIEIFYQRYCQMVTLCTALRTARAHSYSRMTRLFDFIICNNFVCSVCTCVHNISVYCTQCILTLNSNYPHFSSSYFLIVATVLNISAVWTGNITILFTNLLASRHVYVPHSVDLSFSTQFYIGHPFFSIFGHKI